MSAETSLTPVSYWVRRKREQDAVLADAGSAWTNFVENEASAAAELLAQQAS
jgi:hypothetical protein